MIAGEQRLAGEIDHLGLVEIADERRIEKALVIGSDEHRALGDEVFLADDSQAEQGAERRAEGHPAEPVNPVHGDRRVVGFPIGSPCCLRISMAASTPDSMVWSELSRTVAPSATMSGAVVRLLSAASRLAMESTSPIVAAAGGADVFGGIDVDFVGRVREDHGADVAAFHDDAGVVEVAALEGDEFVADFRDGGDGGDVGVDGFARGVRRRGRRRRW